MESSDETEIPIDTRPESGNIMNLLVVDRDPYTGRVLSAGLERFQNCRAFSVERFPSDLFAALEQKPNIILWDSSLPGTPTLLTQVRAACPEAALALVTVEDRSTLWKDYAWLRLSAVLVKPFGMEVLNDLLDHLIPSSLLPLSTAQFQFLRIGQSVTLRGQEESCTAFVLQISPGHFTVTAALSSLTSSASLSGSMVFVEVAGLDALYSFRSRIREAGDRPGEQWQLDMPRTMKRKERRRSSRLSLISAVSVRLASEKTESAAPFRASIRDLSLGGCLLMAERPLQAGDRLEMDIAELMQPDLLFQGEVKWVGSRLTNGGQTFLAEASGVQFLLPGSSQKEFLKRLLEETSETEEGFTSAVVRTVEPKGSGSQGTSG